MKKIVAVLLVLASFCAIWALTVDSLENSMMINNTSIQSAKSEISKALLDYKDAKAGLTPKVDLTVTGSYLCNPIDSIRINLGDYLNDNSILNGFGSDYITVYEGQEKTYYQFSLSATQPLFTWGKLTNAIKLYEDVYKIRQLQYSDSVEKASTEVKTRFAVLYYLYQIEELLEEQQTISNRLVELSDAAFENGMMLETDALGARVKASQIDVAKAQIEQQIIQMKTALTNLTGVSDFDQLDFDENAFEQQIADVESIDYSSLLGRATADLRNNIQILILLQDVSKLTEKISQFSQNWIPDMALVVSANYQGARLPLVEKDWFGKDDWDATVTIALKTTVFDGGAATRAYKKSKEESSQAVINTDDAKLQISTALTESYSSISVCESQINYQKALADQLNSKIAVQKKLLDSGYGSEADYLQVVLEYNNTKLEILQLNIQLATALYTVNYLCEL